MKAAGNSIDVVIVNYNAGDALVRCVSSVLSQQAKVRVVVADNASEDDSMERLDTLFGHSNELEQVCNGANLGFARAVNAAAASQADSATLLLILNPDCEMLPGSLNALTKALEGDENAALAGPMVVDRHGQPMKGTWRRFPDPWKSFLTFSGLWRLGRRYSLFEGVEHTAALPGSTVESEAVSGACMLMRRELFDELGGMDEAYGLHCEDLDLMYRLRERGLHCLLVPAARVFHQQGLSSKSRPVWVHWQKHRGMKRFFLKFQAKKHSLPVRWLVLTGIWVRFAVTLPLVLLKN